MVMDRDEIDLRPYVVALFRRWYVIALVTALAALAAWGISQTLPIAYSATATVAISIQQTGTQVGVNEPVLDIETIDVVSRRQAVVALAQIDAVESRLPADAVAQAAIPGYRTGMLLNRNRIETRASGDLLFISASAPSAQQAKVLADAWATTYVDLLSQTYTDGHSSARLASAAVLPYAASEPNTPRNVLLGATIGALISILAILLTVMLKLTLPAPRRPAARAQSGDSFPPSPRSSQAIKDSQL